MQLQQEISDRKRAETDREATMQLMQTTLDGMNDPVVLIGTDYQVLWANKAMQENYVGEERPKPFFCYQISHNRDNPCDSSTCTCAMNEVCRELKPVTVMHEHVRADGAVRHLEIVASPLFDVDGNLTGIVEATRDITDRLQMEETLNENENRLALALDVSNCGVWEFNPHTFTDTHLSDRWFSMLGYEPDEFPQTAETWTMLVHPEELERVLQIVQNLTEEKSGYSAEFRMITKDGGYRWVRSAGKIVSWDSDGHPQRMIGLHIDIDERVRMEEALRKQGRSLAKAQQVAKLGHYEWDLKTGAIIWSDELYRIFGLDPDIYSPTPENFWELVYPEDVYMISGENVDVLVRSENQELEFRVIDQTSHEIKYIHLWGETTFDRDGNPENIFGILQEVTERVLAVEAVKESEELHRITIETMPDPVFITDEEGRFVYISPNIQGALGYSTSEIEAMETIQSLVGGDFIDADELVREGEIHNIEQSIADKNGRIQDYLITVKEVAVKGGSHLFTFHDITDRKRANNADLQLATIEERRRLASNLHDSMTQSLHSLKLTTETALHLMEMEDYHVLKKTLHMLDQSAQQAMSEMRLLLYGLRLTADEGVDLIEILNTRLKMVEQRLGIDVDLTVDGAGQIPLDWQSEIFYVAMEALNNTLKHACADRVEVSLVANPYTLELVVLDDGCGFEEVDAANSGMGFQNMAERATRLGGELTIGSHPGKGTSVRLQVDMTDEPDA